MLTSALRRLIDKLLDESPGDANPTIIIINSFSNEEGSEEQRTAPVITVHRASLPLFDDFSNTDEN
jgi:hypothetical protein